MYELNRAESVASEAAVLVGVLLPDRKSHGPPLEELEGLAATAGVRVVGQLTQRREAPDAATYLGHGKVEELTRLAAAADADVVIFDNDLSPGQTRNLEKAIGLKVLDRTELILDIFASRAQTRAGPAGRRTGPARIRDAAAEADVDAPFAAEEGRRAARAGRNAVGRRPPAGRDTGSRICAASWTPSSAARSARWPAGAIVMTVSLVGYTNAGKSTLMNALTGADVFVQDALFATLDTRTRRWQLPGWGPVLLSDTVGFIRDLPHHLIESFKATLEEARQADLLLHVADGANPAVYDQIAAAYSVLEEIGIQQKDTLLVVNKVDALPDRVRLDGLLNRYPNAVPISARTGFGLANLAAAVSEALSRSFLDVDVEMGVENGRLMAYLAAHGEVLSKQYRDSRVVVHCRIPSQHLGRIEDDSIGVRPHGNGEAVASR